MDAKVLLFVGNKMKGRAGIALSWRLYSSIDSQTDQKLLTFRQSEREIDTKRSTTLTVTDSHMDRKIV